jgi:hypothetical protein
LHSPNLPRLPGGSAFTAQSMTPGFGEMFLDAKQWFCRERRGDLALRRRQDHLAVPVMGGCRCGSFYLPPVTAKV